MEVVPTASVRRRAPPACRSSASQQGCTSKQSGYVSFEALTAQGGDRSVLTRQTAAWSEVLASAAEVVQQLSAGIAWLFEPSPILWRRAAAPAKPVDWRTAAALDALCAPPKSDETETFIRHSTKRAATETYVRCGRRGWRKITSPDGGLGAGDLS